MSIKAIRIASEDQNLASERDWLDSLTIKQIEAMCENTFPYLNTMQEAMKRKKKCVLIVTNEMLTLMNLGACELVKAKNKRLDESNHE